jgi:hypothetical protein
MTTPAFAIYKKELPSSPVPDKIVSKLLRQAEEAEPTEWSHKVIGIMISTRPLKTFLTLIPLCNGETNDYFTIDMGDLTLNEINMLNDWIISIQEPIQSGSISFSTQCGSLECNGKSYIWQITYSQVATDLLQFIQ